MNSHEQRGTHLPRRPPDNDLLDGAQQFEQRPQPHRAASRDRNGRDFAEVLLGKHEYLILVQ